jgi:hypothetical protein
MQTLQKNAHFGCAEIYRPPTIRNNVSKVFFCASSSPKTSYMSESSQECDSQTNLFTINKCGWLSLDAETSSWFDPEARLTGSHGQVGNKK